jgi:hypothetical protein
LPHKLLNYWLMKEDDVKEIKRGLNWIVILPPDQDDGEDSASSKLSAIQRGDEMVA